MVAVRPGPHVRGGVRGTPQKDPVRPGAGAWRAQAGGHTVAATARNDITAIDKDGRLFPVEKLEAHRRGQLHLAVSVFLFDGDDMLIQRRAAGKYHCGGLWANSCCTHPYWGESLGDAAQRRTFEELGLSIALSPAGLMTYFASVTRGLFEYERVRIFRGEADKACAELAPDPEEVMATRWVRVARLREEMRAQPQDFAPWFRIYMRRWEKLGLRHAARNGTR